MKLTSRKVLERIGDKLIYFSHKIYMYPQEKRVVPWFKVEGDKTLRLDYELNTNSLVFDLGGYEGQWSSDLFSKYLCTIYVFEPVQEFAREISLRFQNNPKIHVFNFGLSECSEICNISISKDSSSIFKSQGEFETIKLVKFQEFFEEKDLKFIDLIKINIEGGEYELLEHLINSDLIQKISSIQVQFHDFVPDAEARMKSIQTKLSQTHKLTWQYPFVWENWQLKQE